MCIAGCIVVATSTIVVGLCMFPASLIMGILWQQFNPTVAFVFGASLALVSAVGLSLFVRK